MGGGLPYLSSSGWIDPPGDVGEPLVGSLRRDAVVIGGGYTGMAATLRLAERGASVALLESAFCGWGASSRNAGHLTPTIAGDPQLLATVFRRRAGELVGFADAAVHFTAGLIERLGVECAYEPVGNVSAPLSPRALGRCRKIAERLASVGAEVDFVAGDEAGLPAGFPGGIRERAGGILDPGRFSRGLRAAVRASTADVFERSRATAIERRHGDFVVRTAGGEIRAERLLLATNAFTRELGATPLRIVTPLWVTLAETGPIDAARLAALGWTSRAGIYTQHVVLESYRLTDRGTIVFGSRRVQPARGALGARRPDPAVVADIVRGFHDRFPSLRDVAAARTWGGWIAMTGSWLPLAGELPSGALYALGYNGHGLAQAPYAGTLLADRAAGEPVGPLESIWRRRAPTLPSPLFSGAALRAGWALDRLGDRLRAAREPTRRT